MSGLYFGLMHLDGQQFLYAFAMGIVFCYMVYKTNSIFSSIISHFTINSSQTLLLRLQNMYVKDNNIDISSMSPNSNDILVLVIQLGLVVLFTLPILIFCFYMLHRVNEKRQAEAFNFEVEKNPFEPISIQFETIENSNDNLFNIPFFVFFSNIYNNCVNPYYTVINKKRPILVFFYL